MVLLAMSFPVILLTLVLGAEALERRFPTSAAQPTADPAGATGLDEG